MYHTVATISLSLSPSPSTRPPPDPPALFSPCARALLCLRTTQHAVAAFVRSACLSNQCRKCSRSILSCTYRDCCSASDYTSLPPPTRYAVLASVPGQMPCGQLHRFHLSTCHQMNPKSQGRPRPMLLAARIRQPSRRPVASSSTQVRHQHRSCTRRG